MAECMEVIVEGCYRDDLKLHYFPLQFDIPMNSLALNDGCEKYLLYARTDFEKFDYQKLPKTLKGGFLLERKESNIRWIFEANRSFITRDGRIFIRSAFFDKGLDYYLKYLPVIIADTGALFRGELSIDKLNAMRNNNS